jgi:hypothetical protein
LEGESFVPPANSEIVWGVNVTNLPNALWVYQVRSGNMFSAPAFSNILSASQLKLINSVPVDPYFKAMDSNFMTLQIMNERGTILHSLNVAPNMGWVKYSDNFSDPNALLIASPSEKETIELGKHCMFLFGIDRSLYNPIPRFMSVSTTTYKTQTNVITARGVAFSRKIDGIIEHGSCLYIEFRGKNKILKFELNWRNLVPYKSYPIADTNDILQFIKSGNATWGIAPKQGDPSHVQKFTITRFEPIYFSKPPMDKIGFEYPYAELTLQGQVGTNTMQFYLHCPLMK